MRTVPFRLQYRVIVAVTVWVFAMPVLPVLNAFMEHRASGNEKPAKISVIAWLDRAEYTIADVATIYAGVQNDGDAPVYIDRRATWSDWSGRSAGFMVDVLDENGRPPSLPYTVPSASMAAPAYATTDLLLRLDKGRFYGSSLRLPVSELFAKGGRFSVRVAYKSLLLKGESAPKLRRLPVIWADMRTVKSAPIQITVTP